jgi:hypothetical protein
MKVLALAVLILAALSGVADARCNPREECSKHCIARNTVKDRDRNADRERHNDRERGDNRCIKWQSDPSCEARKAECDKCVKQFLLMGMSEQSAADRC